MTKRALLLAAIFWLSGCAVSPAHRDAGESMGHFESLAADPRIFYEPGAQEYAERLAPLLPGAIARVESGHYRPFPTPVRVYICGSDECFTNLVPDPPNLTAAVIYENRLLLHPRLFDREPHRLLPVLVHELSHLHLGQQIGHYTSHVPIWFHEGLAAHVADGGGADLASEEEATRAILAGIHIRPGEKNDPSPSKSADDPSPTINIFYRQSMMFVDYLRSLGEEKFRHFLLLIQERVDFDSAFATAFGIDRAKAAAGFFDRIRCAAGMC